MPFMLFYTLLVDFIGLGMDGKENVISSGPLMSFCKALYTTSLLETSGMITIKYLDQKKETNSDLRFKLFIFRCPCGYLVEHYNCSHLHPLMISALQWKSFPPTACKYLLADLKRRKFEVSTNPNVSDDINALLVWKLEFIVIGNFHFKHISSQLQHNLQKKNRVNYNEMMVCSRLVITM